jgi:FixJ family two-component response regulator
MIAVVDDDLGMLKAVERLLRAHGFLVMGSTSAEAFLASDASKKADCLVLDIQLDHTSGLELHRRLARSGRAVPVIFITAFEDERTRDEAIEAGCVDYLRKPFPSRLLLAAIQRALNPRSAPSV